jgi:hypothetical protein
VITAALITSRRSGEFTWSSSSRFLIEPASSKTRLDKNPQAMRVRRQTVEHPFATLKMRMGATHFLMRRLKNVATEMALNVLGYNLTRVMNIVGVKPLLAAMRA